MRILLVDDQREITESLKAGIHWDQVGVDEVYTACSSKEAKLILANLNIDILLTDIEMPAEDGLMLFRWTIERCPGVIGIFLTSHADFSYAQKAIGLGGFDYILQPARYTDVEMVLRKAVQKAKENSRIEVLRKGAKLVVEQCDSLMDLMMVRVTEEHSEDAGMLFDSLKKTLSLQCHDCVFWMLWIQVVKFEKEDDWDAGMLKMVFRNVLEELFSHKNACASIACVGEEQFLVYLAVSEGSMNDQEWKAGVEELHSFINQHMGFKIALYPEKGEQKSFSLDCFTALSTKIRRNIEKKADIFWMDITFEDSNDVNEIRIRKAEKYVVNNISRSISRAEVADMLHLNEEYFSRLFKRYTGDTFQDYVGRKRIEQAKKLLESSQLSVSIIASKVGYDNFSHFSKVFKKAIGCTPQEYRKEKTQR